MALIALIAFLLAAPPDLPELTQPVNDFAGVIDTENAAAIDGMSRALKEKTGDVVVVATVSSIEPYADIRELAVKLFENHGKGIAEKGKDNGVLIVLAPNERKVWIEVGYGLEQWITDGFAGETSRLYMAPQFRERRYGAGLRAGVERIAGRIAQGRGVTLDGVRVPTTTVSRGRDGGGALSIGTVLFIFVIILIISRIGGGPGRRRRSVWGVGPWSGWSSGVGPFGGGWGGGDFGSRGGGFGGGFGGFGGGRSGGGGGGASW